MRQPGIRDKVQVQVLVLSFASGMTLGKSLNFSELWFPYLSNEIRIISVSGVTENQMK